MGPGHDDGLRARLEAAQIALDTRLELTDVGFRWGVPAEIRLVIHPPQGPEADAALYPRLEWAWGHDQAGRGELRIRDASSPRRGFLEAFYRLGDEPVRSGRLLAFAAQFGPLGVCAHGKPFGHSDGRCSALLEPADDPAGLRVNWEPLEVWLRYARQVRGILSCAASVRAGRPVAPGDLALVAQGEPEPSRLITTAGWTVESWGAPGMAVTSQLIARWCNTWLKYGQVRPRTYAGPDGQVAAGLTFNG